jgi:hypothetical protein
MKPHLLYTLKVCLTTLLTSSLVTLVIGWIYISLIMLINPVDYYFTFNLPWQHVIVYVLLLAAIIVTSNYLREKYGYKRFVNDRPVSHSIVIFFFLLLFNGNLFLMDIYNLLFSYGPMFLIAFVSSKLYAFKTSNLY